MWIIGGDFGDNAKPVIQTNFSNQITAILIPTTLFGKPHTIRPSHLASVDMVTDENKVSILGACGWGIAGTLIAGPIGAVVGSLLGGKKDVHTILVTLVDQRRFLATCSPAEYKQLLAATITPRPSAPTARRPTPEKLDWSAAVKQEDTISWSSCATPEFPRRAHSRAPRRIAGVFRASRSRYSAPVGRGWIVPCRLTSPRRPD